MKRILVIRGGAIGDFILTLPALDLLRKKFPTTHLEILGSNCIAALAENRYYANAVHSLDSAQLAPFFVAGAEIPDDRAEYFASFDLVLSYLFDPAGIFGANLQRSGVRHLIAGSPKFHGREHAARQLARPLETLGLYLRNCATRLHLNASDRATACEFVDADFAEFIAIHPGSGSASKNWPLEKWKALGDALLGENRRLLIVGGEADERQIAQLKRHWPERQVRFAIGLPLPTLSALLERADIFLGHDSGISHLAAAAGADCILLFGPTDPALWAPADSNVKVVRAPGGNLKELSFEAVWAALPKNYELMRIGIST